MTANGAVIENLSNRKLLWIIAGLTVAQILFFVIGGVFSPEPASNMPFALTPCLDPSLGASEEWFYLRPSRIGCTRVNLEGEAHGGSGVAPPNDSRAIVLVAQMPHVRGGVQLEYSRWFQWLLGVMSVNTRYLDGEGDLTGESLEMHLEVRMGYRDHSDPVNVWHQFISTSVSRQLQCSIEPSQRQNDADYACEPVELFELGSNEHPFYLLNVRLPACDATRHNCRIGRFTGLEIVAIHQNGGFTQVWLVLKTLLAPMVLAAVFWYWRRVRCLTRTPFLVEHAILALGVALAIVDLPVEWLSLWFHMPYLLLLSDLRQGVFYAALLSFWLVFTGEHLVTDKSDHTLSRYWRHLTLVAVSCVCLLVFDICERGVHLSNPFYSIWATRFGANLAYVFISVAIVSMLVYLAFLVYKLARVVLTIKRVQASTAQMHRNRRLKFQAIIWRFQGLMILTLVCAVCTILSYVIEQYGEGQLYSGDVELSEAGETRLSYTSAFFTGTFGLWNVYVLLLLAMYAPSHKRYTDYTAATSSHVGLTSMVGGGRDDNDEAEDEDDMVFEVLDGAEPGTGRGTGTATEGSALTAFLKAAADE